MSIHLKDNAAPAGFSKAAKVSANPNVITTFTDDVFDNLVAEVDAEVDKVNAEDLGSVSDPNNASADKVWAL
jgi:hypothetical protein